MGDWVEHDGSGCPVPKGTIVQIIYRDGKLYGPYPALTEGEHNGTFTAWHWLYDDDDIIAYRICNDDSKEAETREARIASFRKLADINPLDVRKAPAKKKVGA